MKEFGSEKIIFDKMTAVRTSTIITLYGFCICMDSAFIIFVCTNSAEIFFTKLRSACLNYNLPSFFTDSYCAGGI